MLNYETYQHTRIVKEHYTAIKDLDIEERKAIPLIRIYNVFTIPKKVLTELERHRIETLGELLSFYKLGVHKFLRVSGVGEKNLKRLLFLIEQCFPEEMYIERNYYTLGKSETIESKEYWNHYNNSWSIRY